jgi:hypothetical protein
MEARACSHVFNPAGRFLEVMTNPESARTIKIMIYQDNVARLGTPVNPIQGGIGQTRWQSSQRKAEHYAGLRDPGDVAPGLPLG